MQSSSAATNRVLACIAHHGDKNRQWLLAMLASFEQMRYDVDVVVVAEADKPGLPDGVDLRVGLPSSDPWSLPFAHHAVFRQYIDDYDIFVYSEDDTLIEERHISAFIELNDVLPDDLIPGIQRYEVDHSGERSYCSVHSHYRWLPESVTTYSDLTFARFTNDHGGCYIATRAHLERGLRAGALAGEPYAGRYDMLVSAATDLYTRAGLTKVFCLERIDDQVVHHLPNVYLGKLGVDEPTFRVQIDALMALREQTSASFRLLTPEANLPTDVWDRHAFPRPTSDPSGLLDPSAERVLVLGTASGAVERVLETTGVAVTGIAVDPVLRTVARHQGLTVESPADDGHDRGDDRFDALVCLDALQYLDDPRGAIESAIRRLRPGAEVVVTVPDTRRFWIRNKLAPWRTPTPLPSSFATDGVRPTTTRWLRSLLKELDLTGVTVRHQWSSRSDPIGTRDLRSRILGNTVIGKGTVR